MNLPKRVRACGSQLKVGANCLETMLAAVSDADHHDDVDQSGPRAPDPTTYLGRTTATAIGFVRARPVGLSS